MKHILIAFATKSGSTAEVAGAIGKELSQDGVQADVRPISAVRDISPYDAVIVGGPMIMGWHREAVQFLERNQAALSQVPVACFLTALSLTETQARFNSIPVYKDPSLAKPPQNAAKLSFKEKYATVASYLQPVLDKAPQIKPVSAAFFAGKLDCSKLDFLSRLFVQVIIGAQPGDYRNWDAIRVWAASLRPTLVKA
jgi:menaquinone-dependent protoporphyrinogen oxidase